MWVMDLAHQFTMLLIMVGTIYPCITLGLFMIASDKFSTTLALVILFFYTYVIIYSKTWHLLNLPNINICI